MHLHTPSFMCIFMRFLAPSYATFYEHLPSSTVFSYRKLFCTAGTVRRYVHRSKSPGFNLGPQIKRRIGLGWSIRNAPFHGRRIPSLCIASEPWLASHRIQFSRIYSEVITKLWAISNSLHPDSISRSRWLEPRCLVLLLGCAQWKHS